MSEPDSETLEAFIKGRRGGAPNTTNHRLRDVTPRRFRLVPVPRPAAARPTWDPRSPRSRPRRPTPSSSNTPCLQPPPSPSLSARPFAFFAIIQTRVTQLLPTPRLRTWHAQQTCLSTAYDVTPPPSPRFCALRHMRGRRGKRFFGHTGAACSGQGSLQHPRPISASWGRRAKRLVLCDHHFATRTAQDED